MKKVINVVIPLELLKALEIARIEANENRSEYIIKSIINQLKKDKK